MAIYDEIHEQHKKLQEMTLKEKISYILYYYKLHIFAAAAVVVVLYTFIHGYVTQKDYALNAALINSNVYDTSMTKLEPDFIAYSGIDTEQFDVLVDCGMNINYDSSDQMTYGYAQKITAMLNTGDIDVIIADEPVIRSYATIAAFKNLDEVLPDDLKKKIEGKFEYYYYTYEEDGRIPIGLCIEDSKVLQDGYNDGNVKGVYSDSIKPIFTIGTTSKNVENSIKFLEFFLSENNL